MCSLVLRDRPMCVFSYKIVMFYTVSNDHVVQSYTLQTYFGLYLFISLAVC